MPDTTWSSKILHRQRYRPLLDRLARDHRGTTAAYYFDLSWEETLRRHATRAHVTEFGPADMRRWYCRRDLLDWPEERLLTETTTLAENTEHVLTELYP